MGEPLQSRAGKLPGGGLCHLRHLKSWRMTRRMSANATQRRFFAAPKLGRFCSDGGHRAEPQAAEYRWRGNGISRVMFYRQCSMKQHPAQNLRTTSRELGMQDIPTAAQGRAPSSRLLQDILRQAPAEYVTLGWLTSTLHRHSFGIIMLCLGVLATAPVGSSVPGLI